MTTFDEIVTLARQLAGTSGMTEAEFDYSLACDERGTNSALMALGSAAYELANADLPEVDEAITTEGLRQRLRQRRINAHALTDATADEREAMIAAAKIKSYAGWSDAARAQGNRIEYAR